LPAANWIALSLPTSSGLACRTVTPGSEAMAQQYGRNDPKTIKGSAA